ncbi:hypothetical protein [Ochrobactrum chromiisoli]|uniref:Uncharacterized protein n=1 Tax=Ochrobactrum chromiisoli TaxID=2993941 RepID=A0ABT3QRH2_9HYPH|nr:hypothetical protein [Ochrobactrum chromiisoli]MCX2698208.1 hypothetical protein [Ochrobactrum chromiisoli]
MLDHLGTTVTVGGADYDISHLAPFIYTLNAAGPNGMDIRVRVSFSCHVFSEKAAHNAAFDFRDHNGSHRIFCANRYAKCLTLQQGVQNLFDQNGITWEMKDHNQVENMAALAHNPAVRIVRGIHDVILYYFYPSNSEHFEIEMNVLTCHERAVNTTDKHKWNMKQAVRACYFSKERMPMTEDKRRELAQMKADDVRAKRAAKRDKRKASKAKKS